MAIHPTKLLQNLKETNSKQEEKKVQTTDETKTKREYKAEKIQNKQKKSKIKEKEYAVNKDFHTPKFDVTVKRVVERDKVGKESIGFQNLKMDMSLLL